jgi:hypothetical protein
MVPNGTQAVATSSLVTTKWQIDFNNAVVVLTLPTDFLVNGQPPISYVQNTPTRLTLTYTTPVATGQTWVIPNLSPNVRTSTGGFVAAATGTF